MIEGVPAQVVEVLGRTGMRGEASSVKVRVLDGDDRGRIIRRNVLGPIEVGDMLQGSLDERISRCCNSRSG